MAPYLQYITTSDGKGKSFGIMQIFPFPFSLPFSFPFLSLSLSLTSHFPYDEVAIPYLNISPNFIALAM